MRRDPFYLDPVDYKYAPVDADPDFDPEHNKRVVEGIIRHTKELKKKRQSIYNSVLKGKAQELALFLKAREQGGRATDIKEYFGKKKLEELRGQADDPKLQQLYDEQKAQ